MIPVYEYEKLEVPVGVEVLSRDWGEPLVGSTAYSRSDISAGGATGLSSQNSKTHGKATM